MNTETPKYVAPAPDPGLALLTQQNEEAKLQAIQDRTSSASAALMQRYGQRVAMAGQPGITTIAPLLMRSDFGAQGGPLFAPTEAVGIM